MNKTTYPQALKSYNEMQNPNDPIPIYNGEFTLQGEVNGASIEIKVDGSVSYEWMPRKGVVFEGRVEGLTPLSTEYNVLIDGRNIGVATIYNTVLANECRVSGIIRNVVDGDKTIDVTSVAFSIPNFNDFCGDIVSEGKSWHRARLVIEDEIYSITIDKRFHYNELKKSLKEKGGYLFLCDGLITKKSGEPISYEEVCCHEGICGALTYFLTFLNGQRTAPYILRGLHDEEIKWTDYANYMVTPNFPTSFQWWPCSIDGISELWRNFWSLWETDRDFLDTVIHWLTEALNGQIVESRIVAIQNALELIFNWYIVEKLNIIVGTDSEKISAANKNRILISRLNIDNEVPKSQKHLAELVVKNKDIADGPEAIVLIRNAIVHGNEAKRKRLQKININAKVEALFLGVEYVILSLLRIMNYKHQYVSTHASPRNEARNLPWNT